MNWFEQVDSHCERVGPGIWAEPLNAVTNVAFVVSGILLWRRTAGLAAGRVMAAVVMAIGVGSFLFHTRAERWAGLADVLPIVAFILVYVFAASRDFLGLRTGWSLLAAAGFVPFSAVTVPLFALIPGLGSSAGYAPVPLLILIYCAIVRRRSPDTARGLATGAGLLVVSLAFRTIDAPLCASWPRGTHFIWHLLNAVMLGWMIEVWRRHVVARGLASPDGIAKVRRGGTM